MNVTTRTKTVATDPKTEEPAQLLHMQLLTRGRQ
jgi:hypothetical protein